MTQTSYEAADGRQAFINLARAWHARCLADVVVDHAFSHGYHPQHSERLAAYWAEALGGPSDYTEFMGDQSSVLRMHSGNGEHLEMDERAQICFAQALDDAGLPDDPRLRSTLKAYFRWATATMAAHPESPDTRTGRPSAGAVVLGRAGVNGSFGIGTPQQSQAESRQECFRCTLCIERAQKMGWAVHTSVHNRPDKAT